MDGVQAVQGTSLEQPELDDDDDVDVVGPPPPPPPPPASRVRRLSTCLRSFFTHLFSNVGLLTLVGGYVLLGALLFEALEGGYEMNQRGSMKEHRDDCLKELWALTERFNVLYQENWTQQAQEQLRRFETRVVEATKVEGYDGKDPQDQDRQWSFSGALLYSVTVITTIGYGNLAPRTAEGKVVTMLYALVGVPLMLLCLSNLGSFLADTFQFAYSHACCKPCRGGGGSSSSGSTKKQMLQQQEMQQQQMVGYSGGSVSLGPPGSIACPPPHCPPHGLPPPGAAASTLPRVKACRDRPCAGSFGYFSGPVDWNLVGEQPGFFQDREREQQLHNTVVKQADNKVVTRLHHPPHITPDVHRLLTECIEYQVMHEEPGAAAALRELQSNPPAGPAPCSACAACAACSNCPAQHHDGGGGAGLAALEEEPEDDDEDDEDHHHGDRR
ncbi:uncharacterized protein LOC113205761 [Frankliniella occidentalis]|uniref:Uncharacterized protein LOC113205761 n=1 Tax=Frankliniella occidentalis TaxID=133901 RepID=A0A9C6TWB5_FRAOC|nr:uncharacterized protein LOC113205761 [Frankliniella occidentalis]